jgi:acyl carrier protein
MRSNGLEEIEGMLRLFIVEELLDDPYSGDDPLADKAVDSLGHEQLAEFVEESYGIRLDDEDMVKENFESLSALATLVEAKRR